MPDLKNTLSDKEYGELNIIAQKWGLPLEAGDAKSAADHLIQELTDPDLFQSQMKTLPEKARQALFWLQQEDGRVSWSRFSRRYGEVREMGAGQLERTRPDLDPVSTAEDLWYRALIGRGFFETPEGLQEFAFLPDDLKELLGEHFQPLKDSDQMESFLCRPATDQERFREEVVSDRVVDHLATLLAAVRIQQDPEIHMPEASPQEIDFYLALLTAGGLINRDGVPELENLKSFLDLSRKDTIQSVFDIWKDSRQVNELYLLPGLDVEKIDDPRPRKVRTRVLEILDQLDTGTWWSLKSFLGQVKNYFPDFLRNAGEYESWFVRDAAGGEFLTGFEHWEQVEGAYLRYLISGPLHWLGYLDLSHDRENDHPAGFRFSSWADDLKKGQAPDVRTIDSEPIQIRSGGELRLTYHVPRKIRYQIARFCDWKPTKAESYIYRFTPGSLKRAEQQGLKTEHLLILLENHAQAIPPNIRSALLRWGKTGRQATIQSEPILRVQTPGILSKLRQSRISRYLLEELGPTAVIISKGSEEKVAEGLLELGYLTDYEIGSADQD